MNIILLKLHKNRSLQKKKKKFRLLLDSAFAKADAFPKLCKRANLAHAVHDLKLSNQAEDEEIYQKAIQNNRFVLTINFKHFRKLVKKDLPGIIGIESQLSNEDIDKNPDDLIGKATKI